MNIFVTDINPHEAAKSLDDRRLVKMVLETAQIICTAYSQSAFLRPAPTPYKPTYKNHPVCKWASNKEINLWWLTDYFVELSNEYKFRFNKIHKSFEALQVLPFVELTANMPAQCRNTDMYTITFQNCAANASKGLNFKHMSNTIEAYRAYLSARWQLELKSGYQPKFTKRDWPTWYNGPKDIGK